MGAVLLTSTLLCIFLEYKIQTEFIYIECCVEWKEKQKLGEDQQFATDMMIVIC